MPLLLIPLLVLGIVLLYLLVLPLSLLQRYRAGRARRRVQPWVVAINAWMLLLSSAAFLLGAWISGRWIVGAVTHALLGLAAGASLGLLGLALTRFERQARGDFYTPNRWLVMGLTLVVAGRIAFGFWHAWQWTRSGANHASWLAQQGGLLAVGGLLLGHYLAYAWGLRARIRRLSSDSRDHASGG
jgi:hypothetical protein